MRNISLLALLGMVPVWAGEMPEKAADYHAALVKRPESAALFDRFRDAWLEERSVEDLEKELLARAEAKEPGAWSTLGRAWLAAGKTEQALEAFDKARKQSPSAWLDLETAKLRMAAKDFAAAEKDALTVPEGDPQRLEALKVAGLACLRAERIDDALAHWTKAVAAAPGDIGLLEDLTELTRREGRIELALDYCGKWRDATVDAYGKAMATLRRAELLLGSQRFDEAMTELAAVLEVSAEDSWLERESLARAEQAHRQRGNSTGWAAWIGARAEANPARLSFRRTSAQALAAVGKADEALEVLTEVMKRSPGDTAVRWQRIALLEQSMKLSQAYNECAELAAKEKTEAAGLRLAELAFRLEKKDELKRALDGVLAAAEPGKRVGLAGLYARYGLPESSERIWREEAGGEQGALALRLLAKHLQTAGHDKESLEVWKQLGARPVALDRMEAAQMLAAAGERGAAREILTGAREKFSTEPGYEAALADLAMTEEKAEEARAIYLKLARTAKRPDELTAAAKGWLRTSATTPDPIKDLGDETADRCLRAAWLASTGKPLPPIRDGDELERPVRQALLREMGLWAEVVAMLEARPGDRGPLFLSELAEAKLAAGDLTGALAVTQTWRTRVPDQTSPWLFEAGILEKLGKLPDATLLLRRAAARFEDNEEIARRLFATLQQALDPRESLEFAWKRHDRSQDESVRSGWLRQILEVSKQREQLDELLARFEERARRDPASPGPLMALAELAKARGDSRAELDFLRRAATNAPRDAAVISALATLEERSGETARALERHATLARLAPGPDSARSLAQAKIRLGDIEGGMRDMQALAGEKGIDLRALEQSAGDLASRGYVEEAIRLISAVEPSQRTARLEFVRGILLDADGRELEAVDAFIRVMAEPDDPAEAPQRAGYGSNRQQISQFLQGNSGREESIPGVFSGLQVPRSQVEAQIAVKALLSRLAMERGGEIWTKISKAVPQLAVATPEQWHEAMAFSQARQQSGNVRWWEFIRSQPGNPLGVMLLVETGQINQGTPDEVEALLKTPLPPLVQMQLRWGRGGWRSDNPDFMESIKPADWQDEQARSLALSMAFLMSSLASQEANQQKVSSVDCSRVMAVLGKVGFTGAHAGLMELLKARHALLLGNTEDFLKHLTAWDESVRNPSHLNMQQYAYGYGFGHGSPPMDAFESWRKKAGDRAAEALIEKITSPLLRCQLTSESKPGQRLARVKSELAALPKDAPVETRRGLVRLSWSLFPRQYETADGEQVRAIDDNLRKQLEAAVADESDPRMAFEAFIQLKQYRRGDRAVAKTDNLKLKELATKLASSPNPADQAYAAQYTGSYGLRPQRNTPVATRWGGNSSFSGGNSYGSGRSMLPVILAMEDKEQALREAAKLLESSARACAGRPEYLREIIESLSKSELLDAALARISLPPEAGLGRRVAMLTLMDACSKNDRVLSLLEEIAKSRPFEARWTVDLALRRPDDAEMRRLLDSVAERDDFDRIMGGLIKPQNRENANGQLAQLGRLADWAPQAKGRRGWMGAALFMLAKGGGGLQALTLKNTAQIECCRRYLRLVLDDRRLAEIGFRVAVTTFGLESPEGITQAARRVLLSGAYLSEEQIDSEVSGQGRMELASLEYLILEATQKGDEVAFPAEFREQLKTNDPASAAWLDKLLAAKSVSDLPDVSNDKAKSSGWVTLARHEAAMLRAVSLPGRDAWLTSVFRENKFQSLSENLRHVIRASLLDAQKKKALSERLFALLEASAGPRKDWSKKTSSNQSTAPLSLLQQSAELILNAAAEADPATLLAVLDHFRVAKVSVSNPDSVMSRLSASWKTQNRQQAMTDLDDLLGKTREAPYTFGVWQMNYYNEWQNNAGAKPTFRWCLPELLQNLRTDSSSEMIKKVKADPNAGFLDLLQASASSGEAILRRRTLLKAAPDLVKLPVEIRNSVIDQLTANRVDDDTSGLPAVVTARISENAAAQRKQRIAQARNALENLKSGSSGSSYLSQQYGSLLGQVVGDDDALTAEILAAWRPLVEADKSGKEMNAFIEALLSNSRAGLKGTLATLRLLDPLLKDSMPAPRNPNSGDPLGNLWSRLTPENKVDPALWKQIAALSPKFQARIWLAAIRYTGENLELTADPKLVAILRDAAKGGEVTRTALEWLMESARVQRDSQTRINGDKLLAFASALKSAGATPGDLSMLLSVNYSLLPRMENAGALMVKTPGLLAGNKALPAELSSQLLQGVQQLWQRVLNDIRNNGSVVSGLALPASVYPVETAALLKFVFSGGIDISRGYFDRSNMTQMVLSLNDPDLLGLWIKVGGKSLAGELVLIAALLEKDRVAEAIALAPVAGQQMSSSMLRYYTKSLESLVAKLRADPSPQAFRLAVRFSIIPDAQGDHAPVVKMEQRRSQILAEYERLRNGLTIAERAETCLLFRLNYQIGGNSPVLDEFATDQAAREFKTLLSGERSSHLAQLFVPAVCSRVYAGDLSGLDRLTAIIGSLPVARRNEGMFVQSVMTPVHSSLLHHLAGLDGKLPPATLESILTCAKVIASSKQPEYRGMASQLVHFVSTDAASLQAGLKRCDLAGVKPSVSVNYGLLRNSDPATLTKLFRLAILHPVAADVLLDSLNSQRDYAVTNKAFLSALADSKLRARISPTVFLKWNRLSIPLEAVDLEALKLYVTERRAEFDETQRAELDRLLERWQKASDPQVLDQMRLQREKMKLREEQQRRRMQTE